MAAKRDASAPTWGAIRDGLIAMVTTAAGGYVLTKTGSPELAQAAQSFSGDFANVGLGLFVALGVFGRKHLSEYLHRKA